MLNSIKAFGKCIKATAAVEFALYLPILLVLLVGMSEVGYAVAQSVMLEKSLRSGALYAARSQLPLSDASVTAVENLIKTGDPGGTADYLIAGWSDSGASLTITVSNYTLSADSTVLGSNQLPVITVTASVPYLPILGDALQIFGVGNFTFVLSHEQAHIGV